MKHSFDKTCQCARCEKEGRRRAEQASTPHVSYCSCPQCYASTRRQTRQAARYARIAKRERAYENWATNDDGPGDYDANGPNEN